MRPEARSGRPGVSSEGADNARKRAYERRRKFSSVLSGYPIEYLRGSYGLLRRMGIEGPGNRAPALLDDLLSKLARFGFILEFAGGARKLALSIVALRCYVRAIGNVPDKWLGQAISLEQFPNAAISEHNHRRYPFFIIGFFIRISFLIFIELRQESAKFDRD